MRLNLKENQKISMQKPGNLLLKVANKLFTNEEERTNFIDALVNPKQFSPCILWCREKPEDIPFTVETPVDWQPDFVDRLSIGEKPGQHPLHHQGYYYCLDFSSIFAAAVLLVIQPSLPVVFDMCAAPGGKSIFAWRSLSPDLLISNEVIGKRLGMLISNLKRCQINPSAVVNRDPSIFAEIFPASSNLVIVDAPCTGQSLLAKGEKAPGCFHPTAINKSANRQKRIIANSAQIVAPGSYLAYMTCTYSPEENEEVCAWFLERFPQFQAVEIDYLNMYRSHLTNIPCYRMFPQVGLGAGAFTVLFQNCNTDKKDSIDLNSIEPLYIFSNFQTRSNSQD
jgi:16S rRNA C967 or C1407 C5-methylase (RsmB/RsmF family)